MYVFVLLVSPAADGTHLTDPEMLARYTAVYGPPMAPTGRMR